MGAGVAGQSRGRRPRGKIRSTRLTPLSITSQPHLGWGGNERIPEQSCGLDRGPVHVFAHAAAVLDVSHSGKLALSDGWRTRENLTVFGVME